MMHHIVAPGGYLAVFEKREVSNLSKYTKVEYVSGINWKHERKQMTVY